jgi:hypothetical protein
MIYESNGPLEARGGRGRGGNQRIVDYFGALTVSGTGEIKIPCRGRPQEVEVGFSDPVPPKPGCGPSVDDIVNIEIEHLARPFPLWALKISWEIQGGNVREISWRTTVRRR